MKINQRTYCGVPGKIKVQYINIKTTLVISFESAIY